MTGPRASALIFRWGSGTVSGRRLVNFVVASLFGHAWLFYLVRSVDPPVARWTPRTTEVTLLSGGNELALPLLRELEDRTFHLYPHSDVELVSRGLEQHATSFRPSFADHEIELRPLMTREEGESLMFGDRFGKGKLVGLPPRPAARKPEVGAPEAGRTAYLNFGPELVWRKFEVDRERLAEWFRSGQPLYFRVYAGVSPRGVVQVISVAEEFEGRISPEELELVRQSLRFAPARNWAWDWIEIQR